MKQDKQSKMSSHVFNQVFDKYLANSPRNVNKNIEKLRKAQVRIEEQDKFIKSAKYQKPIVNTQPQNIDSEEYYEPFNHAQEEAEQFEEAINLEQLQEPLTPLTDIQEPLIRKKKNLRPPTEQKAEVDDLLPKYQQSSLFSKTINKIISEQLSSSQQAQKIVAQVFTIHGYGHDKIRQTTSHKIHLYQYNNLLREVLRKTMLGLVKLIRQYCLYPGSLIGWKEGDQLELRHAEKWMSPEVYETFKKLIRIVENIRIQPIGKGDLEELYIVIRKRMRVEKQQQIIEQSDEDNEQKRKLDKLIAKARKAKSLKPAKIPFNPQIKRIISSRQSSQNSRQETMKAITNLEQQIAELYVAYKTDGEVQDVLTQRYQDKNWLKAMVAIVINVYTKQGLKKIIEGQHQWAEQHENFPIMNLDLEGIDKFVNRLIDQKIRASLVQIHLWKRIYPMVVAETIQSINKYLLDDEVKP